MTDKELRRMNRSELLEMLIAQIEENETLERDLNKAREELASRKIAIDKAGSIAEAALQLSGIFETAQTAAQQYLDNIQRLSSEQESVCQRMEAQAQTKADAIRAEADAYSERVRSEADAYSQKAHAEADAHWEQVVERAQALLQAQENLRALVQTGEKETPV